MLSPPGIDRHTHLEGSLDPAWVRVEAARRGLILPESLLRLWNGEVLPFEGFIEAFLFGAGFLDSAAAIRAAVEAAVNRLPTVDGPRGIDLWVSPHFLVAHKGLLSLDELWIGLDEGIAAARTSGVSIAVVVDAVNHFGPLHGHATLNLVLPEKPAWVVGFSTGGLEGVPFREWAPVFARARSAGLRIAAHAGENGPGSNVAEAILEGGVARIVHGIRGANDPATLDLLAERRIPVDICLRSNACLVPEMRPHPLPGLLKAGVRCALGTDDPGVMPCDMASEWAEAIRLGLDTAELGLLKGFASADAWCLA